MLWPDGDDPVLNWQDIDGRHDLVHTDALMRQVRNSAEGRGYVDVDQATWQREAAIVKAAWNVVESSPEDIPIIERDGKLFVLSYDHIVS